MDKKWCAVSLYSIAHFAVDFACAYLMFKYVYISGNWYMSVLLYNFFAFAVQMPVGIIVDRLNFNVLCAAAGCALVAGGFFISGLPVLPAVVAGVGNALFHVGGGVDVLNMSGDKSGPLGVFVSPGAFGIYFGTMLGKAAALPDLLIFVLLAIAAVVSLAAGLYSCGSFASNNVPLSVEGLCSPKVLLPVACFFAVVCVRSYAGMVLSFDWKSSLIWSTALICAVVAGKAAGGLLADALGAVWVSAVSLCAAAFLFMFSHYPIAGIAAVFLFNMTMPVTLWATVRLMKGAKGFSFGMLTFALFIGFLPVYLGLDNILSFSGGFSLACLLSALVLVFGLKGGAVS